MKFICIFLLLPFINACHVTPATNTHNQSEVKTFSTAELSPIVQGIYLNAQGLRQDSGEWFYSLPRINENLKLIAEQFSKKSYDFNGKSALIKESVSHIRFPKLTPDELKIDDFKDANVKLSIIRIHTLLTTQEDVMKLLIQLEEQLFEKIENNNHLVQLQSINVQNQKINKSDVKQIVTILRNDFLDILKNILKKEGFTGEDVYTSLVKNLKRLNMEYDYSKSYKDFHVDFAKSFYNGHIVIDDMFDHNIHGPMTHLLQFALIALDKQENPKFYKEHDVLTLIQSIMDYHGKINTHDSYLTDLKQQFQTYFHDKNFNKTDDIFEKFRKYVLYLPQDEEPIKRNNLFYTVDHHLFTKYLDKFLAQNYPSVVLTAEQKIKLQNLFLPILERQPTEDTDLFEFLFDRLYAGNASAAEVLNAILYKNFPLLYFANFPIDYLN